MRRTKCQVMKDMEHTNMEEMDQAAYNFEMQGWSMSLELAPRCDDRNCEICYY